MRIQQAKTKKAKKFNMDALNTVAKEAAKSKKYDKKHGINGY